MLARENALKLVQVKIQNFRSIEEQTITFDEGCVVLVGINESGKSNILKALHTLDSDVTVSRNDLRVERAQEAHVERGVIEFHFELVRREIQEVFDRVSSQFYPACLDMPLLQSGDKTITLFEYCELMAKASWEVSIETNARMMNWWATTTDWSIVTGWLHTGGKNLQIATANSAEFVPPNTVAFSPEHAESPKRTKLTVQFLEQLLSPVLLETAQKNLPRCVFWQYNEKNLLPSSISRDAFVEDPNCCVPLKSIFELADIRGESISNAIRDAKLQAPHRYLQLLRRVSQAATQHVNKVWKDHRDIKIELRSDGEILIPLITEFEVPLDMASRSEGFKRFVSFLLMISAKVKTAELENILLLVDEPENALHPSGARSLSQELIEIGTKNTVVYSTHSIFMIDKNNIARHRIVEKKDGVTVLSKAQKSRMQDEEVLYAAIGYSIFEALKERNVIFEGWRDKEVFRVLSAHIAGSDAAFGQEIARWGIVHAEGVKDIRNVTKILELASRPCLIVSDGDAPALEKRKDYLADRGWGTWVTLPEVCGQAHVQTGEDLLTVDAIVGRCNAFAGAIEGLKMLTPADFPEQSARGPILQRWLGTLGLQKSARDELMHQLKGALYERLSGEELSENAKRLARYIANYAL